MGESLLLLLPWGEGEGKKAYGRKITTELTGLIGKERRRKTKPSSTRRRDRDWQWLPWRERRGGGGGEKKHEEGSAADRNLDLHSIGWRRGESKSPKGYSGQSLAPLLSPIIP